MHVLLICKRFMDTVTMRKRGHTGTPEAVANEQATDVSYEALWAENERLRAENEALWQVWSETETLSEAKQREFASAGAAMGLSLTQIGVLLTIVLPVGRLPSRATVGRWVRHSQRPSHRMGTCSIGLASVWCWWCVWTKPSVIAIPY
jgi:hypothetical protein